MSTSRINLYRALAERLGRGKLDVITGTAATNTNSTTLIDTTRLAYTNADASAYNRCWVYAMVAADASTRGFSHVTDGTYTSAGNLTIAPAITNFATTDTYVITQLPPDDLHDAINEALRNDYVESWFPLSMHIVKNDDNDMEASTLATDYKVSVGNAVAAINTTTVYSGSQSLGLTCNVANEYAALTTQIPVNEDMRLHAAAMCSVTQGDDAAFRIWNVQSAEIDSATSDEVAWMNMQPPVFTIPSGCEQIDLRFEGIGSNDVTYWDQVQVWYDGAGVYPLPSYITGTGQLLDVRAVPRGTAGPGADEDYRTNEYGSYPLRWEWVSKNPNSMTIRVSCGDARPYLVTMRPRPELSSDTATTTANKDTVVDIAADLILDPERGYKRLRAIQAAALVKPEATAPIGTVGVRIG